MKDKIETQKAANKLMRVAVWFLTTMIILDISFNFLSNPSTVLVWLGVLIAFGWAWVSMKTRIFIDLKFKRKKVHKLDE